MAVAWTVTALTFLTSCVPNTATLDFDLKQSPQEVAGTTFRGKYHVPSLRYEKC